MFLRLMTYACLILLLAVVTSREARAAQMAFNVLRQSDWEPYLMFQPTSLSASADWSFKVFDSAGTLQSEGRPGYGYSRGIISFPSFETLRSSVYTMEYKPAGTTQVSVYRLALDAAGESGSTLRASIPSVTGSFLMDQPVTITWPVYPGGTGIGYVQFYTADSGYTPVFSKSVDYTLGTLVTDALPSAGYGTAEVDFTRTVAGAATRLTLLSGPATDLVPTPDVTFYSWQPSAFTVVAPEPGSFATIGVMAALALMRRRSQ